MVGPASSPTGATVTSAALETTFRYVKQWRRVYEVRDLLSTRFLERAIVQVVDRIGRLLDSFTLDQPEARGARADVGGRLRPGRLREDGPGRAGAAARDGRVAAAAEGRPRARRRRGRVRQPPRLRGGSRRLLQRHRRRRGRDSRLAR